jgi:hypothetical protein
VQRFLHGGVDFVCGSGSSRAHHHAALLQCGEPVPRKPAGQRDEMHPDGGLAVHQGKRLADEPVNGFRGEPSGELRAEVVGDGVQAVLGLEFAEVG